MNSRSRKWPLESGSRKDTGQAGSQILGGVFQGGGCERLPVPPMEDRKGGEARGSGAENVGEIGRLETGW